MPFSLKNLKNRLSTKLELRWKITGSILGVLTPIVLALMLLSQRFIKPYLISEAHQLGVSVSQTIATELLNKKYFFKQNAEVLIEERLREFSYLCPNIRRIEVYQKKNNSTTQTLLASTVEEESGLTVPEIQLVTDLTSHYHSDDGNDGEGWEILTPLYSYKRENILTLKENQILGTVRIFSQPN